MTEGAIEEKLASLPMGEPQNEVIRSFGRPHYTVSFDRGENVYDVWEYEMGNFTYRDVGILIFKNGYLVAVRHNTYETLKYLTLVKIIQGAEFTSREEARQNS